MSNTAPRALNTELTRWGIGEREGSRCWNTPTPEWQETNHHLAYIVCNVLLFNAYILWV